VLRDMRHQVWWGSVIFLQLCFGWPAAALSSETIQKIEFLSFEQVQPMLQAMSGKIPKGLSGSGVITAENWTRWMHGEDADIRARLDRGEEDTLTNLLRFGVTYTKEYRIDDQYLLRYGQSSLVNSFAENRANDLIRAMNAPNASEGLAHMRSFLEKKGYSFNTPEDRKKIKSYLLSNLARMRDEVVKYTSLVQQGDRFQLFQDRGISLDTNLWPDFLIHMHLAEMARKGLLRRASVRRIAIVGPGLDFANKENGSDFYPLQTVQPFAVLDSLRQLGLADPGSVEIYTLDISPDVNFHIGRACKLALAGRPYTVQLPWYTDARLTPEYREAFIEYWRKLGASIGEAVPPIAVPAGAAATTQTRAVKIRPEFVQHVTPLDMNIVFQHLAVAPQDGFDLIVGTNVFIYFGAFEQALARKNMALMLKPGGYVLSNDELPGAPTDGLSDSLKTSQIVARNPDRTEYMFSYERK
jgi:CheR methyltransferase, SAM binding domain